MMVYETDKNDGELGHLWNFITLDSSLYVLDCDSVYLPDRMTYFDARSSVQRSAVVFYDGKASRNDSITLMVVSYNRQEQRFGTILDRLPERSTLQSIALIDGTLMLSVNNRSGNGSLVQYDLASHRPRVVVPDVDNDFVLFQLAGLPEEGVFVLAVREYVDRHYKATSFIVYSKDGNRLQSHRFENGEGVGLGRLCFAFDAQRQLMVYATLEREGERKVDVEGVTEDFSKIAVGVTWIKFAVEGTRSKTYLFKNMPDIDRALTSSDRLRVREELLRMQQGKTKEQGEIALQFLTPRLVQFGAYRIFAAEAFQPVYHTEMRMEYGYYGSYPIYYTVFDGYDFFSEILLAFDDEGDLKWQTSVRFENDYCERLFPHAAEAVCDDELLVVSPSHNTLRYEVFDPNGKSLLSQHATTLDFLYATDTFDEEYRSGIFQWYGNRFLVHGCQIVQNPLLRATRRAVYYLQKVQYE